MTIRQTLQRGKNLKSKSANLQLLQKGPPGLEVYNKTSNDMEGPHNYVSLSLFSIIIAANKMIIYG